MLPPMGDMLKLIWSAVIKPFRVSLEGLNAVIDVVLNDIAVTGSLDQQYRVRSR